MTTVSPALKEQVEIQSSLVGAKEAKSEWYFKGSLCPVLSIPGKCTVH